VKPTENSYYKFDYKRSRYIKCVIAFLLLVVPVASGSSVYASGEWVGLKHAVRSILFSYILAASRNKGYILGVIENSCGGIVDWSSIDQVSNLGGILQIFG